MKRNKDKKINIIKNPRDLVQEENQAWDFLEIALEKSGDLFPTSIESVDNLEYLNDISGLPTEMKDVHKVLERGEHILRTGLKIEQDININEEINSCFSAAARNGSAIPQSMLEKMHKDRDVSEENNSNDTD